MMKCPFCGKENKDGSIFCVSCDEVIVDLEAPCDSCRIEFNGDGVWQPGETVIGQIFGDGN